MIDAHHHIWRQADLPWLMGPEQPRIFGPYASIRRDYLIGEYLADLKGTGITKSVYVQANWAPGAYEDEIAWVAGTAEDHGWPHGIIGYLDFQQENVGDALSALVRYPLLRGFRQQFHWHENPQYRFAGGPAEFLNERVVRNINALAAHGWTFDLQVFPDQMADAAKLIAACPEVTFVLQHAGMLEDTSDDGWAVWRSGMEALAAHPNAITKLSAFGTFIHRNDPDFIARIIAETVAIFDADRCMYGSNFPIEKIWTSYADLFAAFQAATATLPASARNAIFDDTADRVYRLT